MRQVRSAGAPRVPWGGAKRCLKRNIIMAVVAMYEVDWSGCMGVAVVKPETACTLGQNPKQCEQAGAAALTIHAACMHASALLPPHPAPHARI